MSRTTLKSLESGNKDHYLELVRRFALRPIRSKAAYEQANRIHQELLARDADLNSAEADYARVLGHLIRDYDEEHFADVLKHKVTPIEILKFLMEQHEMKTINLGELVGGRGQASLILSGKRELSKANIRILADHFKVSPALFI